MSTIVTPAENGEPRDNTVRTRQMTDEEKTGEVPVVIGEATTPLVGIEKAPESDVPVFKPTREQAAEVKAYELNRVNITKFEAILTDDDAKESAKKHAETEIGPERKRLHVHAERLRAWGYIIATDGDEPVPPVKMPSRADRYKQAAKVAEANAPKKASAVKKPPRFEESLRDDVKYARYELSGKNPKLGDKPTHVPGASAGQHIRVRAHIDATLAEAKKDVTPANVLKLTGYATHTALEAVARWEGSRGDLEALQELGQHFKGDSWAQGRYLAAICVAYIRRVRIDADAAKKAKAAADKAAKAEAKVAKKDTASA